ncbi:DUF979 domain-containing protein [Micrococcales bacterium 31B]|nr:DUF979 domain-containing protein [Micrococcales bacterium 31B]
MISAEWVYWLIGALFILVGAQISTDRTNAKRVGSAAFWVLLGASFMYSTFVVQKSAPAWPLGAAVIVLALLAGCGAMGRGTPQEVSEAEKSASARKFGNKLFIPALLVPLIALMFGSVLVKITVGDGGLFAEGQATLVGLGFAGVVALLVGMMIFRPVRASVPFTEGRRLLEYIGWAALLPQLLATLGNIFAQSGVGEAVQSITTAVLPEGSKFAGVAVYCLGMAVFTILMGNAFAAFPIMTAAVGWPVLVQGFEGNPPAIFAIGMLAGFCGTLCTPMAANFNLVPAALLEMKDQYGPIKAQVPTAVPLLVGNIVIMYFFAF